MIRKIVFILMFWNGYCEIFHLIKPFIHEKTVRNISGRFMIGTTYHNCNNLKKVSVFDPLHEISLCPWYWVDDTKNNRNPKRIPKAICACKQFFFGII